MTYKRLVDLDEPGINPHAHSRLTDRERSEQLLDKTYALESLQRTAQEQLAGLGYSDWVIGFESTAEIAAVEQQPVAATNYELSGKRICPEGRHCSVLVQVQAEPTAVLEPASEHHLRTMAHPRVSCPGELCALKRTLPDLHAHCHVPAGTQRGTLDRPVNCESLPLRIVLATPDRSGFSKVLCDGLMALCLLLP